MVYRHRTHSGKWIQFRNKGAYENWKKGMFAHLNPNHSIGRKVRKAQSKRRIKHRGIGKVSSGKKHCLTCKRTGLSIKEGKCKECTEAFATYKQPKEQKLSEDLKYLGRSYVTPFTNEELFQIAARCVDGFQAPFDALFCTLHSQLSTQISRAPAVRSTLQKSSCWGQHPDGLPIGVVADK